MMNVLALCLVLTSLVTGGVWSPTPENPNQNQNPNMIVKEGHRVVTVEYEKEGDHGNTKVVISPADDKGGGGSVHAAVEEKLSEAASATKGAVEDVKDKVKLDAAFHPRELVCDAFGKCKHKIASALGRTKDKVSETAHEVSEKVQEVEEHAKDAYEKAKDVVTEKTHEGVEKAQEMGGSAKDAAGKLKKGLEKAEEMAMDTATKAKSFDAVDTPKRIGEDIEHNVSRKGEGVTESVKEMAKHAEEAAENVKEKGKKGLNKGREFVHDFICYVLPLKRLDSVVDLVHLLGVSMAYGMNVFVSFVSSYVLSRTLTKQQFGMVQSKLYPVYHKVLGVCVGVGLLGHLLGQRRRVFSNKLEMFQAFDLLAALSTVLGNALFLEPRATKLMFERMKFDKEEGKGQTDDPTGGLGNPMCMSSAIGAVETREEPGERHDITTMTERLKKLNMYSSFLNMLTLIFLSWHLIYLGHRLQLTR